MVTPMETDMPPVDLLLLSQELVSATADYNKKQAAADAAQATADDLARVASDAHGVAEGKRQAISSALADFLPSTRVRVS